MRVLVDVALTALFPEVAVARARIVIPGECSEDRPESTMRKLQLMFQGGERNATPIQLRAMRLFPADGPRRYTNGGPRCSDFGTRVRLLCRKSARKTSIEALRQQGADTLCRTRKLPPGPYRNDLRQPASNCCACTSWISRPGCRARLQ
jgi:hypothetical protein